MDGRMKKTCFSPSHALEIEIFPPQESEKAWICVSV